jgi:hypothetical protein
MRTNKLLATSALLLGIGALSTAAHAQLGMPGGGSQPSRLVGAPTTAPGVGKAEPPPPAIPGVRTAPAPAAPAERSAADMSPNEALYDAINRGDTAAARDALSRGADLEATNILGMTPLDLSVDLGRDDISFILLSMRGAEPSHRPPSQQAAAAPPPKPARPTRPGRAPEPPTASLVTTKPARLPPPTQMANETGTPNPSAGFLGFGPR